MESRLFLFELLTGHEPQKVAEPSRLCCSVSNNVVSAAKRRSLEFGHFSNVRSCLPRANEFVALKTLRNDANSEVAERQRDGSQGLQPLVVVRIQGASRSDA